MKNFFKQVGLLLLLSPWWASAQSDKVTINGYVRGASDGEGIIGASVYIQETASGTATNIYGFYSLTLPKGSYTLVFSSVGFKKVTQKIELTQTQKLDVELGEESRELAEVVVRADAEDRNVRSMEMSVNKVEIKTIKKIPALLGEVDLVRAIQLLPGVSTIGEGATGFNVRGGSIDQNLVLLDDAPVYNSSHLFGFFSVFNPDAVKDVKLYKGGVPSQFGGRASSILDVRMKEGNTKQLEVNGGIGLIFSRLSIEAPIIKDKMSFIVAGRRSYIDVLAAPFLTGTNRGSTFNFYDLTAKVNYVINAKNTVFVSGYFGRDAFSATGAGFNWGNATASFRWNHVFGPKLFMNATAFYSNYDYLLDSDVNQTRPNDNFRWNSNIINQSIKPDFTYYINPNHTLTLGGQILRYTFKPGEARATSNGEPRVFGQADKKGLEISAYVGHEAKISNKFSVQYGVRYSNYGYSSDDNIVFELTGAQNDPSRNSDFQVRFVNDGERIATYQNFEPRLAMKYEVGKQSSIKASYNRMAQYVHLMSNTAAATPLDVWTTSTNNIKPQIADQIAVGYFQNFGGQSGNDFESSVEVFYKDLQNQIDYKDQSDLFLNPFFERQLVFGRGRAYGAEFFVKKNKGKVTGWISYTLSRSERQIGLINGGAWYPARFDRRHNLNIVMQYEAGKKWSFSANFALASGVPYTLPQSTFTYEGIESGLTVSGTRGNTLTEAYHRLDVSATKKTRWNIFKKGEGELVFSIYNLYARRNPFAYYPLVNADNSGQLDYVRFSVVGSMIPAVTYNFKF
jgi:CarboxypepD_reg-like domain/TonB-dependent Receptor Plug Domain